jgi:hypothetical protein
MTGTWDAMYEQLTPVYGGMPGFTTQDMLAQFWAGEGFDGFPGNDARMAFYLSRGAVGFSLGDVENDFWSRIGIATSVWTPADLGASLALWLDADDAATITLNGSTVSQWDDKSGNGKHMVQATASAQPTYTTTLSAHGRNVVGGNGIAFMDAANAFTGADSSMIVAGRINSIAIYAGILGSSGSYGNLAFVYNTSVNYSGVPNSSGHISGAYNVLGAGNSGIEYLQHEKAASPSVTYIKNGGTISTGGAAGVTRGTGVHKLFAYAISTPYLDGEAWEAILIDGLPSTDDRQKLEGYLAHKWGLTAKLPVDHPYKTTPPTV